MAEPVKKHKSCTSQLHEPARSPALLHHILNLCGELQVQWQ